MKRLRGHRDIEESQQHYYDPLLRKMKRNSDTNKTLPNWLRQHVSITPAYRSLRRLSRPAGAAQQGPAAESERTRALRRLWNRRLHQDRFIVKMATISF